LARKPPNHLDPRNSSCCKAKKKDREGGEQTMMTILKRTLIKIEDIESIEIVKPRGYEEMDLDQCELTISTKNDERFELILRSDSTSKLEFKERKVGEWLIPKVYKGKSMSEEED
jgi:hypothetical protein